ncbi:trypsin-like serine peptidase [Calidifontibacter terrae]
MASLRAVGWVTMAPILAALLLGAGQDRTAEPAAHIAEPSMPAPAVGALFSHGLAADHDCTASVLASTRGDLILTAAHCVLGTGKGITFAPGYTGGRAPYGTWSVTQAFVDPAWKSRQDPQSDFAILAVARQERDGAEVGVQDVVGGETLGRAPANGQAVQAVAYNAGKDDDPIGCRVTVSYTQGFPTHNCSGYVGGSSGSPWLVNTSDHAMPTVVGVVGGLHQGGCDERTSYSPVFGQDVFGLMVRAEAGDAPDSVPQAGSDGCS